MSGKRDNHGRFLPGVSGNVAGRPKGAVGLAREVRVLTGDGRELLETMLTIARDPEASHADRIRAATVLLDRGWGKPLQSVELHASIIAPSAPRLDFSRLPLDRQRELLHLLREAQPLPPGTDYDPNSA